MRVLRSRLYEVRCQKSADALAKERKQMVGSGDRSEKIRTSIFPRRLTTTASASPSTNWSRSWTASYSPIIDALITHYQAEKMSRRR